MNPELGKTLTLSSITYAIVLGTGIITIWSEGMNLATVLDVACLHNILTDTINLLKMTGLEHNSKLSLPNTYFSCSKISL